LYAKINLLSLFQAEAESREADEAKKKLAKNDTSSLSTLILHNQQSRARQMDAFFADLATRYGGQDEASTTTGRAQSIAKGSTKTTKRTASKSQTSTAKKSAKKGTTQTSSSKSK